MKVLLCTIFVPSLVTAFCGRSLKKPLLHFTKKEIQRLFRSVRVSSKASDESNNMTNGLSKNNVQEEMDDKNDEKSSSNFGKQIKTKNPLRLAVLKLGLTELRFTSPLNYEKRDGLYKCAGCGTNLFSSKGKYDSGSGWPSFWSVFTEENNVSLNKEWDGRIECKCLKCNSHLGHVFGDGPYKNEVQIDDDEVGRNGKMGKRLPRYCINGAALNFIPAEN